MKIFYAVVLLTAIIPTIGLSFIDPSSNKALFLFVPFFSLVLVMAISTFHYHRKRARQKREIEYQEYHSK